MLQKSLSDLEGDVRQQQGGELGESEQLVKRVVQLNEASNWSHYWNRGVAF